MKKIIFLSFAYFCFIVSFLFAQEQKYKENTIIIKIKSGTELESKWFNSNRLMFLEGYTKLLGEHQIYPLFSSNVLKAYEKRLNITKYRAINNVKNNLARICVIKYSSRISPEYASAKLKSHPEIEYAEPMPIHRIDYIPNDPDISMQYYLDKIQVFESWDYIDTNQAILVGIVDTGIDYLHEDLANNIYVNPGEDGVDSEGKSKRSNGKDDDNNGFVDDWRGWDFVSSDPSGQDNDPKPGHPHGTHVAGTIGAVVNNGIGVSGIVNKVKLLPVKIGEDNPYSTSVDNSYEGILYAASMGAKIINCSWGSSVKSEAEQETIDAVLKLGSLVVAASGNSNQDIAYYPAAHNGVLSVSAVDWSDRKAYFSNYNSSVDVSAPGIGIYATVPNNGYEFYDGTSMASPIAGGVAALIRMKYPNYEPLQVIEHLKATTDNIDSENLKYKGKLGTGRVNALKAINSNNVKAIALSSYSLRDENGDNVLEAGEKVELYLNILNVLAQVKNAFVKANSSGEYDFEFINDSVEIGNMGILEAISLKTPIVFKIPQSIPTNYIFTINLEFYDNKGYVSNANVSMTLKPTYRTLDKNNIAVTFNSIGNLAFNDYPNNSQGDGFRYKSSSNILFEGALMIGANSHQISNVARGEEAMVQDNSFNSTQFLTLAEPGVLAALEGNTSFKDGNGSDDVGVAVTEKVYQYNEEGRRDFVIVQYDVINTTKEKFDSLFVGLYFDWDIGPSGSNNQAFFDEQDRFGYMKNIVNPALPWAGVALLSAQQLNYFALDNDGETQENPGVYGGYTIEEKWYTLSSGLKRLTSSVTDASNIISAGPIELNSGDTVRVVFSLFSGLNLEELRNAYRSSSETYMKTDVIKNDIYRSAMLIYPNPASDYLGLYYNDKYFNNDLGYSQSIEIFNFIGERVISEQLIDMRIQRIPISHLPSGVYFLKIGNTKKMFVKI